MEGSDGRPKKVVDFSLKTYKTLLQNLRRTWKNIEWSHWEWIARRMNYNDETIEANRGVFMELKKDIETKIDLLLERLESIREDVNDGKLDIDYIINCGNIGKNFSIEEHLKDLLPAVAMSRIFKEKSWRDYG